MSIEDLKAAQALIAKDMAERSAPKGKRTDRLVEVVKPLPIAPVMVDPVFGSTIRRITAEPNGGPSWRTQSSGNSWSSDSKQFVVINSGGGVMLYDWSAETAIAVGPLTGFGTEVTFDRDTPNVLYGGGYRNDEAIIRRAKTTSPNVGASDIIGVRQLVPDVDKAGRTYLRGLSVAAGKLSFIFGGQSQDLDRYAYVSPLSSLQGLLMDAVTRLGCHLHASVLDLSGRYVVLGPTSKDMEAGHPPNYVWDTQTDTITPMRKNAGGHGAIGSGFSVNNPDDADAMQYLRRNLSTPDVVTEIIAPYPKPPAFLMASHMNYCQARNSVVSATYRYSDGVNAPRREWDDELIEVAMTGVVTRYAHHRSIVSTDGKAFDYWATPKPAVSPDGSAVLFTSNWDRSLGTNSEGARQDVFLLQT